MFQGICINSLLNKQTKKYLVIVTYKSEALLKTALSRVQGLQQKPTQWIKLSGSHLRISVLT